MELQMIHVNRKYINKDGSFDEEAARNNTNFEGFAIISIFFEKHTTRPWGVSFLPIRIFLIENLIFVYDLYDIDFSLKLFSYFLAENVASRCKLILKYLKIKIDISCRFLSIIYLQSN